MVRLLLVLILLTACSDGGGGSNPGPPGPPTSRAVDDSATVDEDSTTTIYVLSNDVSVSSSTLALASAPDHKEARGIDKQVVGYFKGLKSMESPKPLNSDGSAA